MNAWSIILRTLAAIVLIAYPALVYFGMSSGSPRQVSLVLILVMAPAMILRLRKSSQQAVRGLAAVPITIVTILLIAGIEIWGLLEDMAANMGRSGVRVSI